jgi:hypothetical protein
MPALCRADSRQAWGMRVVAAQEGFEIRVVKEEVLTSS